MKNIKWLLVLVAMVVMAPLAMAADASKIAIVDVRSGVMETDEAKLKLEKLKTEFAKEEAEVIGLRNELQKMEERMKKDGAIMSADEKRKIEKDMMEKANEFKFKGQQLQKSSQSEAQEVFTSLLPKFQEAVKAVVDAQKIDLVLHREVVLFSRPDYDITQQVIDKMNGMK